MNSKAFPTVFLGFFISRNVQGYSVVDDLGKITARSRTVLGSQYLGRLSGSPTTSDDTRDEYDRSGGFQHLDENLMQEAFSRAEHMARQTGANAILNLRLQRKEVGCFVVTGRAVYLAPLSPESPPLSTSSLML